MTALLAAARAVHFASLMIIFGGSTYALLLQRRGLMEAPLRGMRALFITAATLATVSALVWLCLIAGQMSGDWQSSLDPGTVELTATATRFGEIFLLRFLGLAALWLMCALGRRTDSLAISLVAGLLLVSLGPVSHAAAGGTDLLSGGALSDGLHLLTAGFWLGGLVVLIMFTRRHWGDAAALARALRIFSTWGTIVVGALVITGLINAVSILPKSEMILYGAYFELLLVKVGLALTMVGLAALNRWSFAPSLRAGGERVTRRLALSVTGEILLGFAIVGIVGFLGLMAPH